MSWFASPPERPLRRPLWFPSQKNAATASSAGRVLIVEDDYLVGLELEHLLSDAGYEVVGLAATASEAIEMATTLEPELAIVDIRLASARDGVDVAIHLRTALAIPSVFATAHDDALTRRRAEAAHPVGWLQKPYSPKSLIAVVTAAIPKDNGHEPGRQDG